MLSKLFGSQCRVKILNKFLLNPEEKYYTRQLSRELNLQVNAVRRELDNLNKMGIIKVLEESDKKSNLRAIKYFKVNQSFILFNELKNLFSKSQLLYSYDFIENIQKLCTPKFLMLSGFFSGDDKSPIDIFLVSINKKNIFIDLVEKLEKEINREINYTIMNQTEFLYRRQIMDRFIREIFNSKYIIVCGQELLEDEKIAKENLNIAVK